MLDRPVSLASWLNPILLCARLELHLHGHRHVLSHCFGESFWLNAISTLQKVLIIQFLHFLVRQGLVGVGLGIDLLDLLDILHYFLKIFTLKLLVLLKDGRLLHIPQNQG